MKGKFFLEAYELIKSDLTKLEINHVFNSIGSNVFFEFGEDQEITFKNGKKDIQKEWSIWAGNVSWKITKYKKYVVGSGDSREAIQLYIQELLGKRFLSLQFNSQFLDAEFSFTEGYCLTTFFDRLAEDQWTIFLPNQTTIGVDGCSYEEVKEIQDQAKDFSIVENYRELEFSQKGLCVSEIVYDENDQPTFLFMSKEIRFQNCTWRLEKGQEYLIGYLDGDFDRVNKLMTKLIGKKLLRMSCASNLMDAKFEFEDQYVIKTFACVYTLDSGTELGLIF